MLKKLKKKIKFISHFIWLILLSFITVLVTYIYESNKNSQKENLNKTLSNIYFQKVFSKITSELENRFVDIDYTVKSGDSFESIINSINLSNNEKKLFIQAIKKNKLINILRPSQKIYIKIDKKENPKILEFIVEVNKKKKFTFLEILKTKAFNQKS